MSNSDDSLISGELSEEQLQTVSGGLVVIAIIPVLIGMLVPSPPSLLPQK